MSVRDIIEAAATTAEAVRTGSDRGIEGANRRQAAWDAKKEFIATFDPEHVALMEAERVAAREFIIDLASGVGFDVKKCDRYVDACRATYAHREERGL